MRAILWTICIVTFGLGAFLIFNYVMDDSYSNTPIEAINKARNRNFVHYVIHEQPVVDGKVIFFIRNINDGQIVVSYEYVRKSLRGWKWVHGGGHSGSGISLTEPNESLGEPMTYHFTDDHSEFGQSPFPLLHGIILDQNIKRVVVKDYVSGLERQAQIIHIRDHFNLYYVFIDPNQGSKFDINAYNDSGEHIFTKTIEEGPSSSAGTESSYSEDEKKLNLDNYEVHPL